MDATGYVVVIGDLMQSKRARSRRELQLEMRSALEGANRRVDPLQPLEITIGDEFQGMFPSLEAALTAILVVQLELGGGDKVRFGVGAGRLDIYEPGRAPYQQDGPAWWAAREAVDAVRQAGPPTLIAYRHAFRSTSQAQHWWTQLTLPGMARELPGPGRVVSDFEALVNGLLVMSGQVVAQLDGRDCRILLSVLDGLSQRQVSEQEGITQPAVSQRLKRSGGLALKRSIEQLGALTT